MKNIISIALAIVIAYFVIHAAYFIMFQVFWAAFALAKIMLALLIALPLYIIIRRKLLR